MQWRNSGVRYGLVAETFHWIIAIGIIVQLCVGLYMTSLPRSDPMQFTLVQLHKAGGLTILWLSLLRLGWRLINPIPPLPAGMGLVMRGLAHFSHFLLYILMIGIPLSGWAMVSASPLGLPINYFGLFNWPRIWFLADMTRAEKMPMAHNLSALHTYLAYSIIALLVIHISAALWHHFARRDDVLKRMIPGTRVEGAT